MSVALPTAVQPPVTMLPSGTHRHVTVNPSGVPAMIGGGAETMTLGDAPATPAATTAPATRESPAMHAVHELFAAIRRVL